MKTSTGSGFVSICILLFSTALIAQGGPGGSGGSGNGGGPGSGACSTSTQQVSLHIPNETVTPGGVAQMKVMVTTPTPISSGGPHFKAPSGMTARGIQLLNPTGDVNGVAIVNGQDVNIAYITSTGAQGSDYPIMTVSLDVPSTMPVGSQMSFALDPSSTWNLGLLGIATLAPMNPATITVGGSISITNIVPGGGLLPAGTVVSIQGLGFQTGTRLQINGLNLTSTTVVSPTEIQIVLSQATNMSGQQVQVVNPDGSQATYFSYVRGIPLQQSSQPLLATTIPIFSSVSYSSAVFTSAASTSTQFTGVAVQNSNLTSATVTFTLSTAAGTLGSSTIVIPSGYRLMEATSELVQGITPPLGSSLRVSSNMPIQVFGFQGDTDAGTVVPFTPLSSQP